MSPRFLAALTAMFLLVGSACGRLRLLTYTVEVRGNSDLVDFVEGDGVFGVAPLFGNGGGINGGTSPGVAFALCRADGSVFFETGSIVIDEPFGGGSGEDIAVADRTGWQELTEDALPDELLIGRVDAAESDWTAASEVIAVVFHDEDAVCGEGSKVDGGVFELGRPIARSEAVPLGVNRGLGQATGPGVAPSQPTTIVTFESGLILLD